MPKDICSVCGTKIKTMCFRGTGVCCEDHRKQRDGEHDEIRAQVHAAAVPAVTKVRATDASAIH